MQIKNLIGLACGLALLTPGAASAADLTVSISGDDVVTRGEAKQFIASCVGCSGMKYYEWDRENDGTILDYDKGMFIPVIFNEFTTLGQQTIRVSMEDRDIMTNAKLGQGSATKTVTVVNAKPELEFSCDPTRVETRERFTCELDHYEDPDDAESTPSYVWDVDGDGFDDGTGDELTTSYATAGEKTVRMRVTDDDGGQTVKEAGVDVWQPPVGPAFQMSASTVEEGTDVTFTAPFGSGEQGDVAYHRSWDFDGDGEWDESGVGKRIVSQFFDEPGTYSVRLRVRADGQPDSATITTQQLVVRVRPVVEEKPGDDKQSTGGGQQQPTGGPAPVVQPGPAVVGPPAAVALTRVAPPAAKRPAAKKKAKTCKAAKRKKGKRSRSCAATKKKASRAKSRKRR